MKLLVVSEGPHELEGALSILVRRLVDIACETATERVSSKKVRRHPLPGGGGEYEKRFLGWIDFAAREGYDAIVIVVDEDGRTDRVQGARRAQEFSRLLLPRAIGIAIRSFDAWMIADEMAWDAALSVSCDRCSKPEGILIPGASPGIDSHRRRPMFDCGLRIEKLPGRRTSIPSRRGAPGDSDRSRVV